MYPPDTLHNMVGKMYVPAFHAPRIGAIFTTRGVRAAAAAADDVVVVPPLLNGVAVAPKPWRTGTRAPIRMAVSLTRLRSLSSPLGQRWQCAQAWPFWHPCGFQNQAHGRHWPSSCNDEPADGRFPAEAAAISAGAAAGLFCTAPTGVVGKASADTFTGDPPRGDPKGELLAAAEGEAAPANEIVEGVTSAS